MMLEDAADILEQLGPLKSAGQVQKKPLSCSVHDPSFLHGFGLQVIAGTVDKS